MSLSDYQLVGRSVRLAALADMQLTREQAAEAIRVFREKHPATVEFWRRLEEADRGVPSPELAEALRQAPDELKRMPASWEHVVRSVWRGLPARRCVRCGTAFPPPPEDLDPEVRAELERVDTCSPCLQKSLAVSASKLL